MLQLNNIRLNYRRIKMTISKLRTSKVTPEILDENHKWETALPLLLNLANTNVVQSNLLDVATESQWKGDFYGLLLSFKIPYRLLYPTMKLNGLNASHQYNKEIGELKLYDNQYLDDFYDKYIKNK